MYGGYKNQGGKVIDNNDKVAQFNLGLIIRWIKKDTFPQRIDSNSIHPHEKQVSWKES